MESSSYHSETKPPEQPTRLTFLKLGGSLITDKSQPRTPRLDSLTRLAQEIATARRQNPDLRLIIGHGAGSFAHVPAKKFNTRLGVHTLEEWRGFSEVWWEAAALNRLVMDALHAEDLPVIALPPSAGITAQDGQIINWNLHPLQAALETNLLPVVFGDVIFDRVRGGTILSTEDLFDYLAKALRPQRILLAGIEEGVWNDPIHRTQLIQEITPTTFHQVQATLGGSHSTDVTGGMASKVSQSVSLVQEYPDLEVLIFSGITPGNITRTLAGESLGTTIHNLRYN